MTTANNPVVTAEKALATALIKDIPLPVPGGVVYIKVSDLRAALQSIGPMRGMPDNAVNRLYAYSVPNSGSWDGQEFLDAVADALKSLGIEGQG